MRLFVPVIAGVCLLSALHANAVQEEKIQGSGSLVFGFLPILSTQKLVERFGPLTDYLGKRLGRPVRFETAPGYAEFVRRTNIERRYDMLFTAPHFYYTAQRQAGYKAIVRVDAPQMKAIIVAPKTGGIKALADLQSRSISVPDPLSLGVLLIKNHLANAGLDPDRQVKIVTTPTHNAALLSAHKRITDAAGLMVPPFLRAEPRVRDSMRIIATTRGTPHMPISVASRVQEIDKARIRQILASLKQDEEGKRILKHMSWPGFVVTTPSEYDQMEWAANLIKM